MDKKSNSKKREKSLSRADKAIIAKKTEISKKSRFRRQFNPLYDGAIGEINLQPSQTRPDMALSIHELLKNHTRGINTDVHENQGHFFDIEIPQFDDITEQIAWKEELAEKIKEAEIKAKEEFEEINKAKREALEAQKEQLILEAKQRIKADEAHQKDV